MLHPGSMRETSIIQEVRGNASVLGLELAEADEVEPSAVERRSPVGLNFGSSCSGDCPEDGGLGERRDRDRADRNDLDEDPLGVLLVGGLGGPLPDELPGGALRRPPLCAAGATGGTGPVSVLHLCSSIFIHKITEKKWRTLFRNY